jgi:hypothetical protein
MKCINKHSRCRKSNREHGYSMLEYAAGAAIILAILYGAMNLLEGGVTNLFSSISDWATSHGDHLRNQRPNQ